MAKPKYSQTDQQSHSLKSQLSRSSTASSEASQDFRRDASNVFTPTPSISGPIPPLPNRTQPASRENSHRRPSTSSSKFNAFSFSPSSKNAEAHKSVASTIPNNNTSNNSGYASPIPRSSSSGSARSANSIASFHRGSMASIRTNDTLAPVQSQALQRSSIYSMNDDTHSLSTTKSKSASEFHLERPADDSVIDQMFEDLIVSHRLILSFLFSQNY